MTSILVTLRHRVRQAILVLVLGSLLSLTSLYFPSGQLSYAATATVQPQEEVIQPFKYSQPAGSREEAYEKAAEAAQNPKQLEKAEAKEYKAAKKAQKEEQPSSGLVEGAKGLLEKVTDDN